MFSGLLPNNINIFATTAANSTESSYACYYDEERETYLGDVYSVNWIEDSDSRVLLKAETLQQQFSLVLKETNTSHVKEFGDRSIGRIHLNQFQGSKKYNKTYEGKVAISDAVPSGDVPLAIAQKKLLKYQNDKEQRYLNHVKLEEILRSRNFLINSINHLLRKFELKFVSFDTVWNDKKPLTNHECYINLLQNFDNHCFDLSTHPFALRFLYVFVNMCESLDNEDDGNALIIEDWISTIVEHCSRHINGHPFKQIV
jgi:legumain